MKKRTGMMAVEEAVCEAVAVQAGDLVRRGYH